MQKTMIFLFSFLPLLSFSGEIKKISKNKKILATIDSFALEGDIFLIKDNQNNTRGKAKILQTKNNRAILNFEGQARKGWQIIPSTSNKNNRYPASMVNSNFEKNMYSNYNNNQYKAISTGQYVAGGAMGLLLGIGIGHAVQGRYSSRGWIFTVCELGSAFSLGFALASNENKHNVLAITSLVSLIGFRIWEVIDVWLLPSNYKITSTKKEQRLSISPTLLHTHNKINLTNAVGLTLNYRW